MAATAVDGKCDGGDGDGGKCTANANGAARRSQTAAAARQTANGK